MSGNLRYDFNDCLKAMADETRQSILSLLRGHEMCAGELGEHFAISQPTMSYHLAMLRHAHLVVVHRKGRRVFYRANLACVVACSHEILAHFRKEKPEDE